MNYTSHYGPVRVSRYWRRMLRGRILGEIKRMVQPPAPDPSGSAESIARRLDTIERRLLVLESRRAAPAGTVRRRPKELPGGIRAYRAPAGWIGVLMLLFGGLLTGSFIGPLLGIGLLAFAVLVGAFVPPRYAPEEGTPAPVAPPQGAVRATESAPAPRATMEAAIGKRIFAWIGILALLIGITLFIGYSFQNFGTAGKLAVGYACAVLLLGAGRRLRGNFRAYSYVLEGGGWSAVYFVTYALSFVPTVRVIENSTVTLLLLMVVTAAMALVSIREKSVGFTAAAFALGYFTAIIGAPFGNFTLWSTLLLALGVLLVSLRMRWYAFSVVGSVLTYFAFYAWETHLFSLAGLRSDYLTGAFFLILYGSLFGAGHVLARAEHPDELHAARVGVAVNVGMSFFAAWLLFTDAQVHPSNIALLYAGILAIFFGLTYLYPRAVHLRTTYLVLTVSAFTLFLGLRLTGSDLTYAWLVEGAALVALGAFTSNHTLRMLGYLIALLASLLVIRDATIGGTTSASPYATRGSRNPGIALFGAGFWLIVSYLLRSVRGRLPPEEHVLGAAFGDTAVGFVVIVLQTEVTRNLVSIATGILGLLVLAYGFTIRSAHARLLGIAVLGFTVARVFLIDVAGLDNFGKMLSFLALGALLLTVAYVYNRSRSVRSHDGEGPNT